MSNYNTFLKTLQISEVLNPLTTGPEINIGHFLFFVKVSHKNLRKLSAENSLFSPTSGKNTFKGLNHEKTNEK